MTLKHNVTLRDPKMYALIKFGITTSNDIEYLLLAQFSGTEDRGQRHGGTQTVRNFCDCKVYPQA